MNYLMRQSTRYLGRYLSTTPTKVREMQGKQKEYKLMSWKYLGGATVVAGAMTAYMMYVRNEKRERIKNEKNRQLGKAKIGGPFELLDPQGNIVKSTDLIGKWLLIYFGFTHCPDICPDELQKLAEVIDMHDKGSSPPPLQPLFISVDPDRDTPELVGKYCKEFTPRLLGLTGSPEQVKQACKSYRVYFSTGPQDVDDDYIVDHTVIIYLVNPDGDFVDYFGINKNAKEIYESMSLNMTKYAHGGGKKTYWL